MAKKRNRDLGREFEDDSQSGAGLQIDYSAISGGMRECISLSAIASFSASEIFVCKPY